jgi:hypothetical protein
MTRLCLRIYFIMSRARHLIAKIQDSANFAYIGNFPYSIPRKGNYDMWIFDSDVKELKSFFDKHLVTK